MNQFVWILDPIDGSKYYARGVPLYSISLALAHRGRLLLGVVYIPNTDQMFRAAIGRGSTLNGHRVRCSSPQRLEDCAICLEIPSRHSPVEQWERAQVVMGKLVSHVQRVRILGVASIGLCYCAMGGFDAYINIGESRKYCDTAAGRVILEGSGGVFIESEGGIIAGAPEIARKIGDLLKIT